MNMMELGRLKPPLCVPRGATITVWCEGRHQVSGHEPYQGVFLQWVREPGLVVDEEPWWAKIINSDGRIEVVRSARITRKR